MIRETGKVLVGETFSYTVFSQKGGFYGAHGTPSGSATVVAMKDCVFKLIPNPQIAHIAIHPKPS